MKSSKFVTLQTTLANSIGELNDIHASTCIHVIGF